MIWENFKSAIRSIMSNKLRSFLTLLGIVIGIASLVAMTGTTEGFKKDLEAQFKSYGAYTVYAWITGTPSSGKGKGHLARYFRLYDIKRIKEKCPHALYVSPDLAELVTSKTEKDSYTSVVEGVSPEAFRMLDFQLEEGRFFTSYEYESSRKVAVIASKVKEKLFGDEPALGKEVVVKHLRFKIVGVLKQKKSSHMGGGGIYNDPNRKIFIPATTYIKLISKKKEFYSLMASAPDREHVPHLKAELRSYIRSIRRTRPDEEEDFDVISISDLYELVNKVLLGFNAFLIGIGSLALLTGGIGIMNIMLVSVTERFKEIGLRKSLGARDGDILFQFLVESVTLCVLGGIVGMGFGFVIIKLVALIPNWPGKPVFDFAVLTVGFLVSTAVGVLFGIWPAYKAAKLDPITALKYE